MLYESVYEKKIKKIEKKEKKRTIKKFHDICYVSRDSRQAVWIYRDRKEAWLSSLDEDSIFTKCVTDFKYLII